MIFQIISIVLYTICLILLWRNIKVSEQQISSFSIYLIAVFATVMHVIALYQIMYSHGEIIISIGAAIS
ncbi:MAG: hypothetical protein OXE41_11405, partial [Gammaproteobacteria bacterium]|nr:hypothetical protein [Gammaproteobacteria bacterium]